MDRGLAALALASVLAGCATPPTGRAPEAPVGELPGRIEEGPALKVLAQFVGECRDHEVALYLRADHSYRLTQPRDKAGQVPVSIEGELGDWSVSGSGYTLTSLNGVNWLLEPPLDGNPVAQAYFARQHPELDGCRLSAPL